MGNILRILIITCAILLLLIGCENKSENPTTSTADLKTYNRDYYAEISGQACKAIKITNYYGGIIVIGWSRQDSVRVYMYKSIKAESENVALSHFNDIKYQIVKNNDSLELNISSPASTDKLVYNYCSLCLFIPYSMMCKINYSKGQIFIDQLDSDIAILNCTDQVQIQRHYGSCEVVASASIDVKMILPDRGISSLYSKSGNISVSIPDTTSSVVTATCLIGYVSYSNLNFTSLVMSEKYLNGTLRDGRSTIILKADKGNINIGGF